MSVIGPDGNARPGRIAVYAVLGVALLLAAVWGCREYRASTSQARGTLAIQDQRGSAGNREHWSAFFTEKYHDLQADQANIKIDAKMAARPDSTRVDAVTLSGTQQACDQDVSDWNAALDNILAVVPEQYPQTKLNPDSVCSTNPDTTGFLTP